jgi:uncharacterized repeat protein (TIGR01451 family)
MSLLPIENTFAASATRRLCIPAILLFICGCQTLPTTLQLDKPGQAKATRSESAKPSRLVAPASDVKRPRPAPMQPTPAEPPVPPKTIVDEHSNSSQQSLRSIGSTAESGNETQAESIDSPATASISCPTCPIGPVGLPASAFGSLESGPGIAAYEEYVCNGGDRDTAVIVGRDWRVFGLHQGDTVVHYDTIDGKTHVEPSNDVCLYAPRFAAIRKVYGIVISEQHDRPAGVELPIAAVQSGEVDEATTVVQPLQPGRKHAIRTAQQFRERQPGEGIENQQRPATTEEQFLPFENLTIIRRGFYDNAEKARLAERLEAAVFWTHDQAPQVLIDNKTAVQLIGNVGLQSTYTYELPPGQSRVRVCKIASKQNAKPGETVDFTIRFDNIGERVIGNVTLIDRLHERLELVPNSQSCSLKANFSTEDEEGSPRVLRWEITEPLKACHGGIVRFQCRVR